MEISTHSQNIQTHMLYNCTYTLPYLVDPLKIKCIILVRWKIQPEGIYIIILCMRDCYLAREGYIKVKLRYV